MSKGEWKRNKEMYNFILPILTDGNMHTTNDIRIALQKDSIFTSAKIIEREMLGLVGKEKVDRYTMRRRQKNITLWRLNPNAKV